ncbi:MAG TPA: hypothetical protein VG452_06950 [Egibacteraceae bacterium]|nr:hypothetical protein [Egibacteraceae bacterium]
MRVRYGRWTGTQEPFPAEVSADEVLEEIADELLAGVGADQALQRLLRRGMAGRVGGLEALRRRVEQARRRELSRMGLEAPLRRVAEQLEAILGRERTALDFDASSDAPAKRAFVDDLPPDVAARLAALQDYRWTDPRAGEDFRRLLEQLRRDVAEATLGRLAGALGSMSGDDLRRVRELLADLNALVAARDRGEEPDFEAFKAKHADLLPGDPDSLDELLEELARRMAALSALMAALDPDQRAQLAQMAERLLGDLDLSFEAEQLRRNLQRLHPELAWDQAVPGALPEGAQPGSLADTVDWVEHLRSFEDLARALRQDYPGARLEDVSEDDLRRALGDDAVRDLRALREIERILEEAGAASRNRGRLELTARGIRRLGERSLARIYDRAVAGALGSHRARGAGGDGELTGSSRPLRFGDPFRLEVSRTLFNAVARAGPIARPRPSAADARARSRPALPVVRLAPEDFELAEAERRVRVATVLLLDMSFSMPLRGNWVPAKRVALALHSLVSSKFPEDRFYVVGFSDYARRLRPRDLLAAGWERVYGTNMQHAFMLARRLLGAHPASEQQVIMVTDGEPTAHLEGQTAHFAWPPEPTTLRLTMAEAQRLARAGATLNVFLLDHDPGAGAFVDKMVRVVGGRIFYPDLAELGRLVVRDFLQRRR